MGEVTALIERAQAGDRSAFDSLFSLLHPELRRIAHARLTRNARDVLLDTTALVNECYLKLVRSHRLKASAREHFLAYAATAMRSIIVDAARSARAERRGGGAGHVTLSSEIVAAVATAEDEIVDVDEALQELARIDPRLVRVVEMRYFAGMTNEEIGAAVGLTERTVRRDWEKARLLLAHALRG